MIFEYAYHYDEIENTFIGSVCDATDVIVFEFDYVQVIHYIKQGIMNHIDDLDGVLLLLIQRDIAVEGVDYVREFNECNIISWWMDREDA